MHIIMAVDNWYTDTAQCFNTWLYLMLISTLQGKYYSLHFVEDK